MGLGTVMQTALSGMNAAQVSIQVAAQNLANLQTPGFKASRVHLATLSPATPYYAGGPGMSLVVGGVQVVGIDTDFSSGALDPSDDQPALWTLQGEGLFILESESGERVYTRDGRFRFNADGELVTTDGLRIMGFAADADGQVDTSRLVALRIAASSQSPAAGGGPVTLRRFTVGAGGKLLGHFSDGSRRVVGQLRLARFANPSGLAHPGRQHVPRHGCFRTAAGRQSRQPRLRRSHQRRQRAIKHRPRPRADRAGAGRQPVPRQPRGVQHR